MYNLLCVSSQGKSSRSVLIKRKQERSPQKMGTFYNFNRLRSKSKTFYFPLYLSNMTGRLIWSESIWTGGLSEYFPGLTWMYGESNEKLRRWPGNTIDYLKHIDLKNQKNPQQCLLVSSSRWSHMSNFSPVGHIWPSMQLNPASNIISCQLLMIPQRPQVRMHCNNCSAIKMSTHPRCSGGAALVSSQHSRTRLCVQELHERGQWPSHCKSHVCYHWDLFPEWKLPTLSSIQLCEGVMHASPGPYPPLFLLLLTQLAFSGRPPSS